MVCNGRVAEVSSINSRVLVNGCDLGVDSLDNHMILLMHRDCIPTHPRICIGVLSRGYRGYFTVLLSALAVRLALAGGVRWRHGRRVVSGWLRYPLRWFTSVATLRPHASHVS